jgi:hypothetical protein
MLVVLIVLTITMVVGSLVVGRGFAQERGCLFLLGLAIIGSSVGIAAACDLMFVSSLEAWGFATTLAMMFSYFTSLPEGRA